MSLSDRLNKLVEHKSKEQSGQEAIHSIHERAAKFISDNARLEFDHLTSKIAALIERTNPSLNGVPKFEFNGSWIVQNNCVATVTFDKPVYDKPFNQLLVSIGTHPMALYFDEGDRPDPLRYRFEASATDAIDGIVWVGDSAEFTTDQLCEFVLETLTEYYLRHQPG
jgi:hypothetical protein